MSSPELTLPQGIALMRIARLPHATGVVHKTVGDALVMRQLATWNGSRESISLTTKGLQRAAALNGSVGI